jgi:hypothetical protein|tara:strand:+ start:434 stop:682 length:249 start_codon:yes stop_codon:yes gene_type:complete
LISTLPGLNPLDNSFFAAQFYHYSEIGILAGDLKRKYSKKGITLSTADILIAVIAIKKHPIFMTNNEKHSPEKEVTLYCYVI